MRDNIWEEKFSDNYNPGLFIKIIKKIERFRRDEMISMLPESGKTFVDLACGDGDFIKQVEGRFDNLIGYDIARNRINNAKDILKGNKKVLLEVRNLDNGIPLHDDSVDVVVCEASLSYFNDISYILEEVRRILKKNGVFIVQVPNYAFLPRRVALLLGKLPTTSNFSGFGDGGAKHYFTTATLKKLFESNGFNVSAISNSGVFASIRKIRPQLLAGDMIFNVIKK